MGIELAWGWSGHGDRVDMGIKCGHGDGVGMGRVGMGMEWVWG
jgi:hypothetical protein